jgi:beta-lactamase regulating signal transducer with metallopeptidase domain
MYDAPDFAFQAFGHALFALALGAALMVAATLVVERLMTQAAMRRVLWQATLAGLCALFAFELSGTSHALSSLFARSSHPTASKTDIQAAPANLDESLIPQTADSALVPPYALYDLPAISTSHAPPLFPNGEGHAYPEPAPFRTDSAKALSATLPSAPRQFLAEPALQGDTAQNRLPSRSYRRQTVGNVAPRVTSPARFQAPASVAAIPESNSESSAATILVLLWLVGTCALGGRAVVARVKLSRQRWQWHTSDEPNLEQLVESLSHRIGMKRTVRIRVTNGLPTPVAFGILRPTVLVPTDFTKRFSDAQQQVILAHELAHLAGSDPAWLFASELVTALMWWHPLAHVARRRLLAASEQAADEACVIVPGGPDVLAECLVKLGRRLTGKPRLGWVAAEGSGLRSGLARRVQQLLKLSDRPAHHVARRVPAASRSIAVVLLVVLTIFCTLWIHPKTSFAKGEETMNVLRGSWRQSLAAVALTAFLGSLSTDAAADESPDGPPKPAQLEDGSPVDQLLLVQRGERERGEREVREPRERDRDAEHREREGREHHERGERERDAEHRERGPRERAQREGEEHRERLAEEREELRQRAEEIEHEKAEFQRDAEQEARELEEGIRETQEEIEELERHFVELEETLDELRKKRAEEADDDHDDGEEEDEDEELEEIDEAIADVCEELEGAREEREELAERANELKREMRELQVNVRRRMAELDREFAVIRAQLSRMEVAGREDPERAEIMRRMGELEREIAELNRAGKHGEARELHAEIRELHARLAGPRDREPREGMERLEAMERELHELREAGRHERAEQLERELHELHRRVHAPRDGDRPGPSPELQARIDHLHVAMENLHAAGLHEQAEQIAQQIERLMHEHDPDARPPHEGRPEPGHEIVGQLRGEIEQLRRENEEMRRMMQEIREAQERFMKELRERK